MGIRDVVKHLLFFCMIPQLQSLRGILAIMIFLHHIPYNGDGVFGAGGDAGVAFFFILSGFVLSMAYSRRVEFNSREWMIRKIRRIYPLNWICLVLYFILIPGADFLSRLPVHFLDIALLQSYVPRSSVFFSCNSVAWFLSDIMLCYGVFIVARHLIDCDAKARKVTAIVLGVVYISICAVVPDRYVTPILYVFPPVRVVDFIIGIMLYCVWRDSAKIRLMRLSPQNRNIAEIVAVITVVAAIILWAYVPERVQVASMWWLPWSAVIVVFSTTNPGIIGKMLENRCLVWLGGISFPFYMTHYIAITYFKGIFNDTGMGFVWLFVSAFGSALICSVLISRILRLNLRHGK